MLNICLIIGMYLYTLIPLSSNVSKKSSDGKKRDLSLWPKGKYNKNEEVAVLKTD